MTKKKHKLSFDNVDICLLGISSHENDYRLIWAINESINIQLKHDENLVVQNKKHSEIQRFTVYSCFDELAMLKYHVISNTCENGFLIEKLKNLDFIMQVSGETALQNLDSIMQRLREIKIVTAVLMVDTEKIIPRDKQNLLAELTLI